MKTAMTAALALSMMIGSAFGAAKQDATKTTTTTTDTKATTAKVKKHKKSVKSSTAMKPAAASAPASK
jgi:hypothetical protein